MKQLIKKQGILLILLNQKSRNEAWSRGGSRSSSSLLALLSSVFIFTLWQHCSYGTTQSPRIKRCTGLEPPSPSKVSSLTLGATVGHRYPKQSVYREIALTGWPDPRSCIMVESLHWNTIGNSQSTLPTRGSGCWADLPQSTTAPSGPWAMNSRLCQTSCSGHHIIGWQQPLIVLTLWKCASTSNQGCNSPREPTAAYLPAKPRCN